MTTPEPVEQGPDTEGSGTERAGSGVSGTERPGSVGPERAGSGVSGTERPGSVGPERPGSVGPERPGSVGPERAGSGVSGTERPGSVGPERSGSDGSIPGARATVEHGTGHNTEGRNTEVFKVVALVVALVLVLGFYFLLLGRIAFSLVGSGEVAAIIIGIGVLILPFLGVWIVTATVRAALAHQHLARRIHKEGLELDTADLPRRPSGRIEREAADQLFQRVEQEWEADPDNWRVSYRLARAYDYAGDRSRARDTMRRAVALEKHERDQGPRMH